jgi:hypothetical protein
MFIISAKKDSKGLLRKNFMGRLCSDNFMGEDAEKSPHQASEWVFEHENTSTRIPFIIYDKLEPENIAVEAQNQNKARIVILADLTSPEFMVEIRSKVEEINGIKQLNPVSLFIVAENSHLLQSKELEEKNKELQDYVRSFAKDNSKQLMKIEAATCVSAERGLDFDQLKQNFLIEKLLASIELLGNKQTKKISGLDELVRIQNNKELSLEQRVEKMINVAKWKKSDFGVTRFFHHTFRGRDKEIEGLYQDLAKLPLPNKTPANYASLITATSKVEKMIESMKPSPPQSQQKQV